MASTTQIVFSPLSYLKIKQPQKRWFDYILPILLSIFFSFIIIYCDINYKNIELFSDKGIINIINNLTQILSGFYLTSMAAIATFPNKDMDKVMDGIPPKIDNKDLTRREFLIRLFGYLCFVCILLYFIGGLSIYFFDFVILSFTWTKIIKFSFCIFYFLIFFNMLLTTFMGLYFLIIKINKEKTKLDIDD
ncbi:hypothetical protein [Gilliamella apicola]|uniref:Uncharacterized protein n=1 Tax=Gilliamella apicola TaxID=1196095 RepID=A0A242NF13_9GAMM|nr:hypothetical protein [Gilliamella apicola]OTP84545.1 hypothetical protein B5S44_09830 [Gilliamella apicola]OTP98354.1 hypothetical protein B6D08_11470 [Gilliamella apicola]